VSGHCVLQEKALTAVGRRLDVERGAWALLCVPATQFSSERGMRRAPASSSRTSIARTKDVTRPHAAALTLSRSVRVVLPSKSLLACELERWRPRVRLSLVPVSDRWPGAIRETNSTTDPVAESTTIFCHRVGAARPQ